MPFIDYNNFPKISAKEIQTSINDRNTLPVNSTETEMHVNASTAIVYCEGNLGENDGKTANGLVRYSEKYRILSIIDSTKAGLDAGVVLGEQPCGIPVCYDLDESLAISKSTPGCFIFGSAPSNGRFSIQERSIIIEAMEYGMDIVNGLHEFLSDDPVFIEASRANEVNVYDIRKPRTKKYLHLFTGRIHQVTCPRIAILGTDCAIGKRTTATILTKALNDCGIKATMVSTGQTGIIQGAQYGLPLDAIPSQFCAGELEETIVEAFETEKPDIIIVEGQGALSHPAFSTSSFILRGSCPDGVILQHAPGRINRCDFETMKMPEPFSEIKLIEIFSGSKVIGLTINHENMTSRSVALAINRYENELDIPVADPLAQSSEQLVNIVLQSFPKLREKLRQV